MHQLDDVVDGKSVREVLRLKHPPAGQVAHAALIDGDPPPGPHPVFFNSVDHHVIKRSVLNTHGAAGPSGVDADGWRNMCSAFSDAS